MADVFHNGQKIGYTNRQGQFVPVNGGASSNGGYSSNNYSNSNSRNNNSGEQFKKSGATYSKIKNSELSEGHLIVNAWRKTKAGLMLAKCTPISDYDKDGNPTGITVHKGQDKGNEFVRYKVVITINGMMQKYYTLMRLDTRKIVIKELSLVISPKGSGKTASGKKVTGYFGSNFERS